MTAVPRTILLVDDEPHITHVMALKLRGAGFTVVTARDGEEALELAKEHRPDLVITDLQMPYMSGLELCVRLRRTPETSETPALMLTARGYVLDPFDLQQTNIKQVLPKPFSARDILARAQEVLAAGAAPGAGSIDREAA
jgi:two-component system, OmpR family, alkaline phosphatase synthesis response regulator PhoP